MTGEDVFLGGHLRELEFCRGRPDHLGHRGEVGGVGCKDVSGETPKRSQIRVKHGAMKDGRTVAVDMFGRAWSKWLRGNREVRKPQEYVEGVCVCGWMGGLHSYLCWSLFWLYCSRRRWSGRLSLATRRKPSTCQEGRAGAARQVRPSGGWKGGTMPPPPNPRLLRC